jgi:hypothetical protein
MTIAQKTILDLMGDTAICTVWPAEGENDYGQVTFGTPYTIKCERGTKSGVTRTPQGDEVVFSATFYTEKGSVTELVKKGDRIISSDKTTEPNPVTAGAFEVLNIEESSGVLSTDLPDLAIRC